MIQKKWLKKLTAAVLAGAMAAGVAGCSSISPDGGEPEGADSRVYVYEPEYLDWKDDLDTQVKNMWTEGNRVMFSDSSGCCKYLDLDSQDAQPAVIYDGSSTELSEEGFESGVDRILPDGEGGIIVITRQMPSIDEENATEEDWARQLQESTWHMKKVTKDKTVAYEEDISQYVLMDGDMPYLVYAAGDGEGNIYLSNGNSYVWIFDKEGRHLNDVRLKDNSRISDCINLGVLGDGRAAVATDANEGMDMHLVAYDAAKKDFSDAYDNLPPNIWGTDITPGPDGGVLLKGNSALYEYEPETRTYTELMAWQDYDINPEYISFTAALENGSIVAYYDDGNGKKQLILLKRMEETDRESEDGTTAVLTLGYRKWKYADLSYRLETAVTDFNKKNSGYRIETKGYEDPVDLNNDIVAGNAPDMFVESDVNIELFAAKGIIEDLTPWLEGSQVIDRSDLFESVLDSYTIDGVLCTIPPVVWITTLVGRTSEVGEETGWTLDEMLSCAGEYPDRNLFPYDSRETVLFYLIRYNFESYVNWETGECSFDSDEFKKILELASQYKEEWDGSTTEPEALMNHKALLCRYMFTGPDEWQVLEQVFGEPVTAVGFPSGESSGIVVNSRDGICISADSPYKEAAWSFVETLLSEKPKEDIVGIPINKTAYNDIVKKRMEPVYQCDEEGNLVLDSNGNPVEIPYTTGDWENIPYDLYAVTQQQADKMLALINSAQRERNYGEELWSIILEEAGAYFEGQKSVDDVADIIQNRARIFVMERK